MNGALQPEVRCGKCRECAWWKYDVTYDEEWGICEITQSRLGVPRHEDTLAYGDGTCSEQVLSLCPVAYLSVRFDFGCVQWEHRDDETIK